MWEYLKKCSLFAVKNPHPAIYFVCLMFVSFIDLEHEMQESMENIKLSVGFIVVNWMIFIKECVFYFLPSRKLNIYVRQSSIDMEIPHIASKKSASGTKLLKEISDNDISWLIRNPTEKDSSCPFHKQSLSTAQFSCIMFLNTDKGL